MISRRLNVLFVDKENASTSVIAEKLLQHWGKDKFNTFSSGIEPASDVDPLALQIIKRKRLPIEGLQPKGLNEFTHSAALHFDFVISLIDKEESGFLGELQGDPIIVHWNLKNGIFDVLADDDQYQLRQICNFLENRIKIFSNLKFTTFDRRALIEELDAISSYKLENEQLDNEHQMLLNFTQRLSSAIEDGRSPDVLLNIAYEIQKYALFHFFSEERLMKEANFPELHEHSMLHINLMAELSDKLCNLTTDQDSFRELCIFLEEWFLTHILREDAKLVSFLAGASDNRDLVL